jgi:hypothetical protein
MCVPLKSTLIYKNIVYNRNKGKLKEKAGGDIRISPLALLFATNKRRKLRLDKPRFLKPGFMVVP